MKKAVLLCLTIASCRGESFYYKNCLYHLHQEEGYNKSCGSSYHISKVEDKEKEEQQRSEKALEPVPNLF